MQKISWNTLKKLDIKNQVLLLPTDTLYGLHCLVDDKKTITKINNLKKRSASKTFIILISRIEDLEKFDIKITKNQKSFLRKVWPGRVSIIFDYHGKKYSFLSKDFHSLAFRVPAHRQLRQLLSKTGPLVSTSANISKNPTIFTPETVPTEIAKKIDFYIPTIIKNKSSSTLLKILR